MLFSSKITILHIFDRFDTLKKKKNSLHETSQTLAQCSDAWWRRWKTHAAALLACDPYCGGKWLPLQDEFTPNVN